MKSSTTTNPSPPPLLFMDYPLPFLQENLDTPLPLNNFLKILKPIINSAGGRGRRAHTMRYLYNFHFSYLKKCGIFSDNAAIYEIDNCARWELLFTLYYMIFIDLSYGIQISSSFCSIM